MTEYTYYCLLYFITFLVRAAFFVVKVESKGKKGCKKQRVQLCTGGKLHDLVWLKRGAILCYFVLFCAIFCYFGVVGDIRPSSNNLTKIENDFRI